MEERPLSCDSDCGPRIVARIISLAALVCRRPVAYGLLFALEIEEAAGGVGVGQGSIERPVDHGGPRCAAQLAWPTYTREGPWTRKAT